MVFFILRFESPANSLLESLKFNGSNGMFYVELKEGKLIPFEKLIYKKLLKNKSAKE